METSAGALSSPLRDQTTRFIALYALAAAGASASYAPFLTLILPIKMSTMAGAEAVQALSYSAFLGAIAASAANIVFGWASDRTGNRTGWIVCGLLSSCTLLVSMRFVESVSHLLLMICAWQVSLNMMLSPLAAWAGDCIPDHQKGLLGGLLSLAPGAGALTGALVTIPGLASGDDRLILIALIVLALVLPLLLFGRPRPMPDLIQAKSAEPSSADASDTPIVPVWRMWLARLLVQIAEASLFAFLLLWLIGLDGRTSDNMVANIFSVVLICSVPIAIFAGRWSDRLGRPIYPLIAASCCCVAGLLVMAGAGSVMPGIVGYCVFGVAAAVFLALHSSQTLRVLPNPMQRGRDLGFFNLTNTIPSLIMPGLSLALIPQFGFSTLFVILAILVAVSPMLLATRRVG